MEAWTYLLALTASDPEGRPTICDRLQEKGVFVQNPRVLRTKPMAGVAIVA